MPAFSSKTEFDAAWPPDVGTARIHAYLAAQGLSHVGMIRYVKKVITAADLATAATPAIFTPATGESWALRDLKIGPGALTNFHSGGDRLLAIQSSTNIFSVIPNASLETLVAAAWFSTALPAPATPAHGDGLITLAAPLVAAYSGGSTDHSAGSITLLACVERMV